MVESRPEHQVNFDQLVHIKAYQDGYLEYFKKYNEVKGKLWGTNKKLHRFDKTSSFLPFTPDGNGTYRQSEQFDDLPRPYRPGFA